MLLHKLRIALVNDFCAIFQFRIRSNFSVYPHPNTQFGGQMRNALSHKLVACEGKVVTLSTPIFPTPNTY